MIIVDDREFAQHPEIGTLLEVPHRVERLDSADYAFLDRNTEPVGVERCEISNLIAKMRSGELESQLTRCSEAYSSVILLVEGVYDTMSGLLAHYHKSREGNTYFRNRIEPYTRYTDVKALMVRLSELGIELMETANFDCSMSLVRTLYQQRLKPEDKHTLFKKLRQVVIPAKLSANPMVPRLLALCPRMSEKVAIRLINQYDSIWNVLNAPDEDLMEIEGFSKGSLANLKKGIGKP